ncbi:MMPL family transporter [Nocardia colli]|uniref:MMPL family transporter n=2 Tax=Nocardia colli TaxID=2545717 RepID=A0A5N0E329_9NOCA|nr:MMPL family transporter [Nocardia colli]KAA8883817.1 MMPL family transporter [Nocardia colli]
MRMWDRFAAVVTARKSWLLLVLLAAVSAGLIGGIGGNDAAGEAPNSLPGSAESAQVKELLTQFPDAGTAPAVVVVTRTDAAELRVDDLTGLRSKLGDLAMSPDRKAAIGRLPVDAKLSGFALTDRINELRDTVKAGQPADLRIQVTGGPAFGGDIADSFAGANITLLAVTAAVVALLLIVTYRSPVLWLVPLLVVGSADRVAATVGTGLARLTGLAFDGSTSGITSVLVFGAGTNYALLLVSRYRDELHRNTDHRTALRHAVRHAGPAILASNVTVVAALLTLLLASLPNTRSLGVGAAAGLVVAVVFVLVALPAALALFGRNVFWPFVPQADERIAAEQGMWHAIAAGVVRRPVLVACGTLVVLGGFAAGLIGTDVGLSQTDQFRVRAESVEGFDTLAAHFPAGAANPTIVLARGDSAAGVEQALRALPGVTQVTPTGTAPSGLARWSVVLNAEPGSPEAFSTIESMRGELASIPGALVGGGDAEGLDTRRAAEHDQRVVIPMILAVVLIILLALLRAVPAAVLLVGVSVLSALAALGLGAWIGLHLFGFPALDTSAPLYAFLFLVALGVDYTIFLVSRAREETPDHGSTQGIVRAVSATGAVITSAGIVLAAVFCVLGVLPLIILTQLGIIVGLGILLDTFLVRTVVIPALFRLIGPKIWWPNPLSRIRDQGAGTTPHSGA